MNRTSAPPERETLTFESDPGAGRSRWIAGALVVVLAAWLGSGVLFPAPEEAEDGAVAGNPGPVAVAVRRSAAEQITQYFVAEGQAQPDRMTAIRAETGGEVAEVLAEKGAMLEAGQVIARIGLAQRAAERDRAEAELARARRDFENAETLLDRGVATVDRVARTRAALAAAEAQVAAAQEAVENATLRAPFAARLESLAIEPGEFVALGAEIGRVVDSDPLTVTFRVPQQARGRLSEGQEAAVRFITGEERTGRLTFLGGAADPETRTFAAEVEVANADGAVPAGVSAELRLPTGEARAHFLSPAILSLSAEGRLGIKTVDPEDRVVFRPVEILRAQTDGVWVSGLPDKVRIITVGQGFVRDGETVDPRPEDALGTGARRGAPPAAPDTGAGAE